MGGGDKLGDAGGRGRKGGGGGGGGGTTQKRMNKREGRNRPKQNEQLFKVE